MAAEAVPGGDAATSGSTETLRRVKQVETDLETKLAATRAETERLLAQVRADVELMIRSGQAESEKARDLAVTSARSKLEAEADAILRAGEAEAQKVETTLKVDLTAMRQKLLGVVLAGFSEVRGD
ncbi:MAG TPA: hypothetical protein VEY07_08415 [Thermoplasmata archaeon]|nr:hypothetical protein [Thermoplasmata archaeon]